MSRPQKVPLVAAAFVAVLLSAGCSKLVYQNSADEQAASVADSYLPKKIDTQLADLETKDNAVRATKVQSWLDESNPEGIEPPPLTRVRAGPRDGSTVPVAVYYRVREGMYTEATWGLVCRDYVIHDRVEVLDKTCPEGTPDTAIPREVLGD